MQHSLYGMGWLIFGLTHSVLARDGVKAVLKPYFSAYYRLTYNIIALLQLGLVYGAGHVLYAEAMPYSRPDGLIWGQMGIYGAGWLLLFFALRSYDLLTLSGVRQIYDHFKGFLAHDEEPLRFDGLHQWVRHPLYSAGFLILWGRVSDDFSLMTAIFGSFYLWIGSFFEERHLIQMYGDPYATYKSRVPAFLPYRGRLQIKSQDHDRL